MVDWKAYGLDRWPTLLVVVVGMMLVVNPAEATTQKSNFSIPAQDAGSALVQFGVQSGVSIAFTADTVRASRTRAVFGEFTSMEALGRMLEGSGLGFEPIGPSSVRILRQRAPRGDSRAAVAAGAEMLPPVVIEDVIVTAQKRKQNLQDVPVAVTVIDQFVLERTGSDRFETYLNFSPGVSFAGVHGNSSINIRGISTSLYSSNQQGTVEVLFDDQPSLNRYYARFNSDLRLVDIDQVEVLRGPQGTLFGSGALGGAVRVVSNKPDPTRASGDLQIGASATQGGDNGHEQKIMLNLPLVEDRLAVRLVGYSILEGGYIDNLARSERNVNDIRSVGARIMLAYRPNDRFSVNAWAWRQRDTTGGDAFGFLNPADGGSYQSGSIDPEDSAKGTATLYNITAEYDLGRARLISISSYATRFGLLDRDYTTFWQSPSQANFDGDVEDYVTSRTRMFSQELRLTSDRNSRLQWILGGFYLKQDVDVTFRRTIDGLGAAKGYPSDLLSLLTVQPLTKELAVFGEGSYAFSDRLTATVGARWFQNTLRFASDRTGFLEGVPTPLRRKTESSITPKFAISYEATENVRIYAQAAMGYRTGQNNFVALPDPVTGRYPPDSYGPDSLWNYEVGFKSMWFDRRFRLNVAAFHIDWRNMQLTRRFTVTTFTDNAGDAVSNGAEIELAAQPFGWLSFGMAPAYTDARLTSVQSGVPVQLGPLPGSARWTVSDFVQLAWRRTSGSEFFVRLDHRYVGAKEAGLEPARDPLAARSEPYNVIDLNVGIETPRFGVIAYVRNLANVDAATGPRELTNTEVATTRVPPRTAGLRLRASF